MPAVMPADVQTLASRQKMRSALNSDGRVFSLKSSCISPVRGRSTSIQQSSRREGKCACADARNPPASARGFNKTAQRISRYERIDRASDDDECIEHGSIKRHCISHHSKAVHHGPLISRKDQEPIGGAFELAIRGFECPGRTGEVEHLKPWGNVETDSGHGRIIGKFGPFGHSLISTMRWQSAKIWI
jgi:hypothetical protein